MKQQRLINGIAILFTLFIVFIIFSANTGRNLALFQITNLPYGDKIAHAGLIGMLTFLLNLAFQSKTFTYLNKNWLIVSVGMVILATIEEFSQIWIASRNFDLLDLGANYFGILVGSFLVFRVRKQQFLAVQS